MKQSELALRLQNACRAVREAEDTLTEIDSRFGDADHGLTMAKIAGAIQGAVTDAQGGIQSMLDDAATEVMMLNGGSAVPLWNVWLDGLQEAAPAGEEMDIAQIQAMFAHALESLSDISGAKVGDKTMMEMLILFKDTVEYLKNKGIEVVGNMVGEILTVQEAAGFQMNIAKWDDECIRLWNTPCHTPAYSKE